MNIQLKIEGATQEQMVQYQKILYALVKVGGMDGVKNGKTIIHFNSEAKFLGIQLDYWPWKERDLTKA